MGLRCLIVDDSASFARAARKLLEVDGIQVVSIASNADDAVADAQRLQPDFALVDLDLGGESGLVVVERLAIMDAPLAARLIVISNHDRDDFIELVAESAAIGFLAKSRLSAAAIRELLELD